MLEGWYVIAAGLLVLSGGAKIRDPEPTRGALHAAGLPSTAPLVHALAVVEIGVAAAALSGGTPVGAVAVGVLYVGFAGFVSLALLRNLPIRSCGCFGRADTPPTVTHLVVTLVSAAAAFAVAARGGPGLADIMAGQPAAGLPYLAFVGMGTFALALLLAEMPPLMAAVRGGR